MVESTHDDKIAARRTTMDVKATINWDELFMGVAALASMRSKDPSTKHGACVVGQDKRVVSIGYNGMPKGQDADYPWDREDVSGIGSKYDYVLHSEQNAILNAPDRKSLSGSVMYVFSPKGYYPCHVCMSEIVQCGIGEVVLAYVMDGNTDKYNWKPTLHMSKVSGVKIRDLGMESKSSFLKMANEFGVISQLIN